MIFYTETGSKYQVDFDLKKIRRVVNSNGNAATNRQGNNSWNIYESITDIKVGHQVMICWNKETIPLFDHSPKNAIPTTITSNVVEVEND
jgi:hypothetical protein